MTLKESRLHLKKQGNSFLFSNYIRENSSVFTRQCILRSPSREFDTRNKSVEYKSKNINTKGTSPE